MSEPDSAPTRLPPQWTLLWAEPGAPAPAGARSLLLSAFPEGTTGIALAFDRGGLGALGGGAFPLGPQVVVVAAFPVLDEALALWALARREAGLPLPRFTDLARYAEDVRQGRWPDAQPVERAVQAIYLALAQHHLLRPSPDRDGFVAEAFALFDHLAGRLEAGAQLAADDLVSNVPALRRYVALLEKDRVLYAEDRARALRFHATVPADATWTGAAREAALLALDRPTATQFKLWARRDPLAPGGNGYALLVVKHASGWALVSADPDRKLRVGGFAGRLTDAERAARGGVGEGAAWCGTRYEGTVCESPLDGTRLTIEQLVEALREPLALRRERRPGRARVAAAAGAALAIAVAVAVGLTGSHQGSAPPAGPGRLRGMEVEPRGGPGGAADVPPDDAQIAGRVDRALVVGCDTYARWSRLYNAELDARRVAAVLHDRFGFEVTLRLCPSAAEFADLVAEATTREYGKADQLLVYVAGHGLFDEVRKQGYLIFRDSAPDTDASHAGTYDLDSVRKAFSAAGARHTLVVLDTCFSGTIADKVAMRGAGVYPQSAQVREHMREPSRLVVTSAGKRLAADGAPGDHSPFAKAFLAELDRAPTARGFVTVRELVGALDQLPSRPYVGPLSPDQDVGFATFVFQWRSAPSPAGVVQPAAAPR